MPGSSTSVFGEPDDFLAALQADGVAGLLVTERGQFRARLTRIALNCVRLIAGEEVLSRIAFVAAPAGMIVVAFSIDGERSALWSGIEPQAGDMMTIGPGERLHALTTGPGHWGLVEVPERSLFRYGRALAGSRFVAPCGIALWRPGAPARHLYRLYRNAIRTARSGSRVLADAEAAHGLEQQVLHALIECLISGLARYRETPAAGLGRDVLARFEDLLQAGPITRMSEICATLGVSDRVLRQHCKTHLAMTPGDYRRRRALQQVHRALRNANPDPATVAEVAARYGFQDLGRFAGVYRAFYGELPSATLRRGAAELSLGRPRIKLS